MATVSPSTSPARLWALIPCAGSGQRAGTALPKQYQPLAGRPLVLHTLDTFFAVTEFAGVLVVVSPGDEFFERQQPNPDAPFFVADCGGATRGQSVLNGLSALQQCGADDADWVLVHDAARCLITPRLIQQLVDACRDDPVGGLLAWPLADTLKLATPDPADASQSRVAATLPRSDKWLAQTPQMFRLGALREALLRAGTTVTDEASAMEAMGVAPRLVQGSAQNFKVTYPDDLVLAEALMTARKGSAP